MEDRRERDRDHQDRKRKYHSSSRDDRRSDYKRRHHDHHERSIDREYKERYSRREEEHPRETEHDPEWRSKWDHILFKQNDFIPKGSPEYAEFREFFSKYKRFSSNVPKPDIFQKKVEEIANNPLNLPATYDNRYRVNFSILPSNKDSAHGLSSKEADELADVRKALHLFHDFKQKQQFAKVVKIQKDREALPIAQYKQGIIDAVNNNQVVLIAGDTGCGKSTQVCQYLMAAGFSNIACSQPRRIATMSLARRVAFETLNEYGSKIAYQIRFDSSKTEETKILFLTEGVLLRQLALDPMLLRYDVIIADEVHERHIHADFLLGILRSVLEKRPGLKLVLMSATINLELFSSNFPGAPVIRVPGRMYPVKVEHIMLQEEEFLPKNDEMASNEQEAAGEDGEGGDKSASESTPTAAAMTNEGRVATALPMSGTRLDPRPYLSILARIDREYPAEERGDVLIFVSGMSDIQLLADEIRHYASQTKKWIVLALHSTLSVEEQDKAFDPVEDGVRKCIISTNIAETAVTINGIRFVIDSGKVKELGYDPETKMSSLQTYWISKASAEQRKGRAGRTGPGTCYRLYSQKLFGRFLPYSIPEIQRIPLESIILQMIALGLGDPREFAFIEKPSPERLAAALTNLEHHQAIIVNEEAMEGKDRYTMTPLGSVLAQLPVDIPIGKMLILGSVFHILDPILTIAASLTVQSPFVTRGNLNDVVAQQRRHAFDSPHGDPFTLLNVFDKWITIKAEPKQSSRKWCREHCLEEQRLYEIAKLRQQFRDILKENKLLPSESDDESRNDDHHLNKGKRGRHGGWTREEKRSHHSKRRQRDQLRMLQMHKDTGRGRRVLRFDEESHDLDAVDQQQIQQAQQQQQQATTLEKEIEKQSESKKGNEENEEEEEEIDVRELDFFLNHDISDLVKHSTRKLSIHDLNLMKIIIASGLYPHFAVGDEHNANRKESDQLYHTKWKGFAVLHPTSVFYSQALQLLTPNDILCYVALLETNKPYLTNILKCPALHTLLLLANSVDTTDDCSRFIVDNWLELELENASSGEKLLIVVHQLRLLLHNFLQEKLVRKDRQVEALESNQDARVAPIYVPKGVPPIIATIHRESNDRTISCSEARLSAKLAEFLETPIACKVSKIKASELHAQLIRVTDELTIGDKHDAMQELEAMKTIQQVGIEHSKGGFKVNHWLRHGSVRHEKTISAGYSSHIKKHWTCDRCGQKLIVNLEEMAKHQQECNPPKQKPAEEEKTAADTKGALEDKKEPAGYYCDVCKKQYTTLVTPMQILRHKKTHA